MIKIHHRKKWRKEYVLYLYCTTSTESTFLFFLFQTIDIGAPAGGAYFIVNFIARQLFEQPLLAIREKYDFV